MSPRRQIAYAVAIVIGVWFVPRFLYGLVSGDSTGRFFDVMNVINVLVLLAAIVYLIVTLAIRNNQRS